MVLAGLVWGFVVPATPFPRLALTAHIQFTSNGVLFTVLAILLLVLSARRWASLGGCDALGRLADVGDARLGSGERLVGGEADLANRRSFGGRHGAEAWQETAATLAHVAAGLGLVIAWTLLIVGFGAVRCRKLVR